MESTRTQPHEPPASPDAAEVRRALAALRRLPADGGVELWWQAFDAADRPALFWLLGVAADLPRLADSSALAALLGPDAAGADPWPELATVGSDLLRLQRLVDEPVVVPGSRSPAVYSAPELESARAELEDSRCVTIDFFFDDGQRRALADTIDRLAADRAGSWGELRRADAPELFALVDAALASDRFRRLTGFDLERDAYSLTLSLQDLAAAGIGWHRDLYWPREWVGEDVFSVLYGLGDDSPGKGGAFLYYVPWHDALYAGFRKRHQATVLWNGRRSDERLLHAVSRYRGGDTSRHLIILQCLRRVS